jgi:hypothetical protein
MTLHAWLRRPVEASQEALFLRARVSRRGMKELDWSAFGGALTQEPDGSGAIAMALPRSSLDFYAGLFLRLGTEAVVESPPELIKMLCRAARALLALYDPRGDEQSDAHPPP